MSIILINVKLTFKKKRRKESSPKIGKNSKYSLRKKKIRQEDNTFLLIFTSKTKAHTTKKIIKFYLFFASKTKALKKILLYLESKFHYTVIVGDLIPQYSQ